MAADREDTAILKLSVRHAILVKTVSNLEPYLTWNLPHHQRHLLIIFTLNLFLRLVSFNHGCFKDSKFPLCDCDNVSVNDTLHIVMTCTKAIEFFSS